MLTPVCSKGLLYSKRNVGIVLDIIVGMSTALDSSVVAQAVAALFKFEEKKQTDAGKQSLVGYYAKPIIAQIQLKEVMKKATIRPVAVKIPHRYGN